MDNWAKIIIGDSRKMVEVHDNSVHLIVTSPPYWYVTSAYQTLLWAVSTGFNSAQSVRTYLFIFVVFYIAFIGHSSNTYNVFIIYICFVCVGLVYPMTEVTGITAPLRPIFIKKIAEHFNLDYRISTIEEENKGIGRIPISIKPMTYSSKDMLSEKLER